MFKILVYGFYDKINLGDQLFKVAFNKLFPSIDFTFTDTIKAYEALSSFDAFFIGGGSFLENPLNISQEALKIVKSKPIFYIGVGAETNIHEQHKELLELAKLIAIRNPDINILTDRIHNKNVISIPDIVYALQAPQSNQKRNKKILFLPNACVVPKHYDPYWKISAWERAKFSIAEALDTLCHTVRGIDSFAMCNNSDSKDTRAMVEIANLMNNGKYVNFFEHTDNFDNDIKFISSYDLVITQRYHGIILSELSNTQHITLYHHDKLRNHHPKQGEYVDYYAISKNKITDAFDNIYNNPRHIQPIDLHKFDELVGRVQQLI